MTIKTQDIQIGEYDYPLPEERIAKFPLQNRDQSKLLIRDKNSIQEETFGNLSKYLPENSLLVFNNTKVIQARLIFRKITGAQIEIFCLEPKTPSDYVLTFQQNHECTWLCMIGNLKKWKDGILSKDISFNDQNTRLSAQKLESYGDTHLVKISWDNPELTFADILESSGELPIPPYLNRKTEEADKETYQTVYSKIKGSVAAPTAGLHFTEDVFNSLKKKNIHCEELTLHVGAGTFKPVKTNTIEQHVMHSEAISVKKSTIEQLLIHKDRTFAVGTTSVRSLESLYYIGVLLEKGEDISSQDLEIGQWMPYSIENNILPVEKALNNILEYLDKSNLHTLTTHTQIMIAPGYKFKIVKGIITNFHQPKSTLLLLVSAFVEGKWKEIYDYALSHDFRFLSYGDSSLLL